MENSLGMMENILEVVVKRQVKQASNWEMSEYRLVRLVNIWYYAVSTVKMLGNSQVNLVNNLEMKENILNLPQVCVEG